MQSEKNPHSWWHSRWLPWAIFAVGCLLFGMNLGARDFWAPDEGEFAQVAKEMEERGEYLVPHLNGKPYSEKPPLFYWSILFFEKLVGTPQEFSARLPSVLSAAGGLVLVFWLGKRIYGARAGLVAAAILASTFRYLWNAAYLQADMLFSFFCLLALCLFWRAQEKEKPRFLADLLPFYLALAAGVLTKGPLAGVIVFLPVFALAIWERDKELLRKLRLFPGLTLVFLLTVWWYAAVGLEAGGGFLRGAIVREHLMRFFESDSHNQPPHYYLLQIWPNLLPWSIFLPFVLWFGWKERSDRGTKFLWLVFVGGVVFLSACSSKQGKYLLPLVPAAALLIAARFERSTREQDIRWGLDLLGALFFLLGGLGLFVSFSQWLPESLVEELRNSEIKPEFAIHHAPMLHGFAVLGFLSLWYRGRGASFRAYFLAAAMATVFLVLAYFYSSLNSLKSHRVLMERTAARMGPGAEFAVYGSFRGSFAYYLGRPVAEIKPAVEDGATAERMSELRRASFEKVREFLDQPEPRFVIVENRDWPGVRPFVEGKSFEIDRGRGESVDLVLLANRPESELPMMGK